MSWNFLDAVKGHFTNELIGKAASYLGESESNVSKGLESVIPAALAGIVNKAEAGDTNSLVSLAKTAFDSGILNNIAGTFSSAGGGVPSIGPTLISSLFGDKYGGIANAISAFTGMKGATTSSLFGTVVPLALSLLGKHVNDNNTTPGALASLLGSQKKSIWSSLPAGLNLSKWLDVAEPVKAAVHHTPVVEEKKKNSWLLPLLLALAGLAALWFFTRGCGGEKEVAAPVVVTDTITKTNIVVVEREPLKVKLPNGVELDAYKGGIEDLLVAFLNDPNAKPGNDNWFDFNDLNFKFGTAEIIPESRKELENITQILKAYPNTKIKLGGYTDKVGDAAANKKLSQERADAVMAALKEAGVGAQVEGAEGYGSEFAKFPETAPEEARLKDRRVSVSVRAK
jgi:outer membrane protein OmpA-like peptidoglycan-associated protein